MRLQSGHRLPQPNGGLVIVIVSRHVGSHRQRPTLPGQLACRARRHRPRPSQGRWPLSRARPSGSRRSRPRSRAAAPAGWCARSVHRNARRRPASPLPSSDNLLPTPTAAFCLSFTIRARLLAAQRIARAAALAGLAPPRSWPRSSKASNWKDYAERAGMNTVKFEDGVRVGPETRSQTDLVCRALLALNDLGLDLRRVTDCF